MNFIKSMHGLDGEQMEFREELWGGLVDHIRTENEKTVTVVFRGGIEITVQYRKNRNRSKRSMENISWPFLH